MIIIEFKNKRLSQRTTEKRVSRAKYGEFITSLFMSEISNYIYIVNHRYLFHQPYFMISCNY